MRGATTFWALVALANLATLYYLLWLLVTGKGCV